MLVTSKTIVADESGLSNWRHRCVLQNTHARTRDE